MVRTAHRLGAIRAPVESGHSATLRNSSVRPVLVGFTTSRLLIMMLMPNSAPPASSNHPATTYWATILPDIGVTQIQAGDHADDRQCRRRTKVVVLWSITTQHHHHRQIDHCEHAEQ